MAWPNAGSFGEPAPSSARHRRSGSETMSAALLALTSSRGAPESFRGRAGPDVCALRIIVGSSLVVVFMDRTSSEMRAIELRHGVDERVGLAVGAIVWV